MYGAFKAFFWVAGKTGGKVLFPLSEKKQSWPYLRQRIFEDDFQSEKGERTYLFSTFPRARVLKKILTTFRTAKPVDFNQHRVRYPLRNQR